MAQAYPPPTQTLEPLTPSEERTWAMLAHLSVLLNLVTGVLGPVAALIIYMIYRDRSRYVAYHSLQSLLLQLIVWLGGGLITAFVWMVVGTLSMIIIGLCLIPFAILVSFIPLAALVYGVIGAIQTNQGQDFRYWLIGDWVRSTYTG
jgi:uncharacterized protein